MIVLYVEFVPEEAVILDFVAMEVEDGVLEAVDFG